MVFVTRAGRWHRHRRRAGDREPRQEFGALTVAVVTKPFKFEGKAPDAGRAGARGAARGRRHHHHDSERRLLTSSIVGRRSPKRS